MNTLTDKERKYLQKARQSARYLPTFGWGMVVFAILVAVIAGIKYEQFISHSRKTTSRYNSYLQSIQPTTELEEKLVKQLRREREFNESIAKMSFILVGFVGVLLLGGIISSGVQLLGMGVIHRRYLKIIEKIEKNE